MGEDLAPVEPFARASALDTRLGRTYALSADQEARRELAELYDAHPEVWREWGDVEAAARNEWAQVAAEGSVAVYEATRRSAEAMAAELAGPAPTPLERLLAGRVAVSHLRMNVADALLAQAERGERRPLKERVYLARLQDRAERQLVASARLLALVRGLIPAAVQQVNIAEQQLNVAGAVNLSRPVERERVTLADLESDRAEGVA